MLVAIALLGACSRNDDRASSTQATPPANTSAASPQAASTGTAGATAAASPRAAVDVSRALLTLDDLPAGWTSVEAPPSDSDLDTGFCGAGSAPVTRLGRAAAEFEAAASGLIVTQIVAAYAPGDAKRVMDFLRDTLKGCTEWRETDAEGREFVYRFASLPFPRLGEQTLAVRMNVEAPGGSVQTDLVIVQRGDAATLLANIASGPRGGASVDSTLTERLARRADARLAAVVSGR